MEKIRLGSVCTTLIDKTFTRVGGKDFIPKGTLVSVCDDDYINEGYVLVEAKGYYTVYEYLLSELKLIKNYL